MTTIPEVVEGKFVPCVPVNTDEQMQGSGGLRRPPPGHGDSTLAALSEEGSGGLHRLSPLAAFPPVYPENR